MLVTVYGLGGFDPSKPNGNVLEQYDDGHPDTTPQDDAAAVIQAVRDPKQETPSVEDRLAAIETLLIPDEG